MVALNLRVDDKLKRRLAARLTVAVFAAAMISTALVGSSAPVAATAANPPGMPASTTAVALRVLPAAPVQGDTLAVLVPAPEGARVAVTFSRTMLPAYPVGGQEYRALVGTDPAVAIGTHVVRATITETGGAVRRLSFVIHLGPGQFGVRRLTLPPKTFGLITPRNLAAESRILGPVLSRRTPAAWWHGPFVAPVPGPVDSPYGLQGVYNGHREWWHAGVDFDAAEGAPVGAAAAGVVALAQALPLGGNTVVIDHGQGVLTEYLHLSAFAVRVGDQVERGTVIGRIGATGLVTGPSLHWGLYVNGLPVNPLFWLRAHPALTAP